MTDRISCPYCNTSFTPTATASRAVCPRCGESVPVPTVATVRPSAVRVPAESANGETTVPYPRPPEPPAVARPLRPLLGLGAAFALLAIGGVLAAVFLRPAPPAPATAAQVKPASIWPPSAVPGLTYLPADATVVAAIQQRALGQYAERSGIEPNEVWSRLGLPDELRAGLSKLGLPSERIDSMVAGVVVKDNNPLPPLVVVLSVAPPFDETALLKGLKATRDPDAAGQYKADLGGLPVSLSKASDTVFVLATRTADLEGLSARANRGSGHLSADLRESINRLSPASAAWVATATAVWADKPELKLWATLAKQPDLPKRLSGVSAAAVGLSLEPDPKLTAAVRIEASARDEVKARLTGLMGAGTNVTADGDWLTTERGLDPKSNGGPK